MNNIFKYWHEPSRTNTCKHPEDEIVLDDCEIHDLINREFNFKYPPGPYFGPLKKAKIVLCYANPSVDEHSLAVIERPETLAMLFAQLNGECDYPFDLEGWKQWFEPKARRLFEDDIEEAAKKVAVFNLVPYASRTFTDNIEKIAICLPSVWMAQQHLRDELIPKAKDGKILLIMCRSKHLWGLRSSHKSDNILINKARNGFTEEVRCKVKRWRNEKGI